MCKLPIAAASAAAKEELPVFFAKLRERETANVREPEDTHQRTKDG